MGFGEVRIGPPARGNGLGPRLSAILALLLATVLLPLPQVVLLLPLALSLLLLAPVLAGAGRGKACQTSEKYVAGRKSLAWRLSKARRHDAWPLFDMKRGLVSAGQKPRSPDICSTICCPPTRQCLSAGPQCGTSGNSQPASNTPERSKSGRLTPSCSLKPRDPCLFVSSCWA